MDRAASAGFEGIAQMLLEQKKLMDALESENRELRRQLADLRRGIGIAVVIEGKTIQLATEAGAPIRPLLLPRRGNNSGLMPLFEDEINSCIFSLLLLLSVKCIVHILEVQALMFVLCTKREDYRGLQKVTSLQEVNR